MVRGGKAGSGGEAGPDGGLEVGRAAAGDGERTGDGRPDGDLEAAPVRGQPPRDPDPLCRLLPRGRCSPIPTFLVCDSGSPESVPVPSGVVSPVPELSTDPAAVSMGRRSLAAPYLRRG